MTNLKELEVWFATGSQHLYGEIALQQVAGHSKEIALSLHTAASMPVSIVFKPVLTTTEEIYALCAEANQSEKCIGIIA